MKAVKSSKFTLTTNHWTLDATSHFDWKVVNSDKNKNSVRDFRKWAVAAYIEERLVLAYRKKLIDKSAAASYLRNTLVSTFAPFVRPSNVIDEASGKKKLIAEYRFPDKLKSNPDVSMDELDIDDVIARNGEVIYIKTARAAINAVQNSIRNLKYAKRTPASNEIDPDVHLYAIHLQRVSLRHSFLSR